MTAMKMKIVLPLIALGVAAPVVVATASEAPAPTRASHSGATWTPDDCIRLNGGDYNACNVGNQGRGDLPYRGEQARTLSARVRRDGAAAVPASSAAGRRRRARSAGGPTPGDDLLVTMSSVGAADRPVFAFEWSREGRSMDEPEPVGISLEAFVRQHALALTRFAFLISGDRGRGEDLVQEVLFSMHRRFGPWLGVDDPLRYARRSIVNAHVSGLRRRRVAEVLYDDPPARPSWDDDGGNPADDGLWDALADLPARQRAVLVLRYYLGYSDREIAQLLDCREGSVRSLAARSFKTLRSVLRSPSAVMGAVQ